MSDTKYQKITKEMFLELINARVKSLNSAIKEKIVEKDESGRSDRLKRVLKMQCFTVEEVWKKLDIKEDTFDNFYATHVFLNDLLKDVTYGTVWKNGELESFYKKFPEPSLFKDMSNFKEKHYKVYEDMKNYNTAEGHFLASNIENFFETFFSKAVRALIENDLHFYENEKALNEAIKKNTEDYLLKNEHLLKTYTKKEIERACKNAFKKYLIQASSGYFCAAKSFSVIMDSELNDFLKKVKRA